MMTPVDTAYLPAQEQPSGAAHPPELAAHAAPVVGAYSAFSGKFAPSDEGEETVFSAKDAFYRSIDPLRMFKDKREFAKFLVESRPNMSIEPALHGAPLDDPGRMSPQLMGAGPAGGIGASGGGFPFVGAAGTWTAMRMRDEYYFTDHDIIPELVVSWTAYSWAFRSVRMMRCSLVRMFFWYIVRPSRIPSLCTRSTRAGIEWCCCHRAVCMARPR